MPANPSDTSDITRKMEMDEDLLNHPYLQPTVKLCHTVDRLIKKNTVLSEDVSKSNKKLSDVVHIKNEIVILWHQILLAYEECKRQAEQLLDDGVKSGLHDFKLEDGRQQSEA